MDNLNAALKTHHMQQQRETMEQKKNIQGKEKIEQGSMSFHK